MEEKYKVDISNDVEFGAGKSNGLGWQQIPLHYKGETIGWIESGTPMMKEGFEHELKDEVIDGKNGKRLVIYSYKDFKPIDSVYKNQ